MANKKTPISYQLEMKDIQELYSLLFKMAGITIGCISLSLVTWFI